MRPNPICLLLAFLTACGGGGGAPATTTSESTTYTKADFTYTDPHPASFHPLGNDSAVLTRRDELVILNVPEDPANARGTLFDDIGVGAGVLGELATLIGPGQFRTGAAGNLDADADAELCTVRTTGSTLVVDRVEREAGSYVRTGGFTIPSAGFTYREARLTLADVDGDHRDELILTARATEHGSPTNSSWVRVYDDPTGGDALLLQVDWPITFPNQALQDVQVVGADVDGDGRDELVLMALRENSFDARTSVRVLDDGAAGFAELTPWTEVGKSWSFDHTRAELLVDDFFGSGVPEIAVAVFSNGDIALHTFDWNAGALQALPVWKTTGTPPNFLEFHPERAWTAVAFDRNADGAAEVALLDPEDLGGVLRVLRWDGAGWQPDGTLNGLFMGYGGAASLVATDDDADGQDELYACYMSGNSSSKTRRMQRIDWGVASAPITNTWSSTAASSGIAYPGVLIAGDLDSDGFAVRYTGVKRTTLSDPKPMVVLSAAPTKAGIDQNYGATSTSYSVTTGSSVSHGVTSGVTASVYAGVDLEDVFGLFGVSARETVSGAFLTSQTSTQSVSLVQAYTGSASADSIVFEGTLYQSYEYEILAAQDPKLVGTFMTFDVPVESRIYKWSVETYNEQVEPKLRIGADVLGHTIGDPNSYLSLSAAQLLTDKYVGWRTDDSKPLTVGIGGISNQLGISLEEELATTEERTFDVTWETGFSAGGSQYGGSFGLTNSSAYTVSASQATNYTATIGDIATFASHAQWNYDLGMAVYHRGLLADGANQPLEQEAGVLPYEVVQFWVAPKGSGY